MSKKILIVGGGIIGICSAYYLSKSGHDVTIIDKYGMNSGASYVNAGYLSPGHIIPLAAPGVIKQGLKWMFNSSSPFYVEPRINLDFFKWLYAFNKSCSNSNVKNSILPIIEISLLSQDLLKDIKNKNKMDFHYDQKGLLDDGDTIYDSACYCIGRFIEFNFSRLGYHQLFLHEISTIAVNYSSKKCKNFRCYYFYGGCN